MFKLLIIFLAIRFHFGNSTLTLDNILVKQFRNLQINLNNFDNSYTIGIINSLSMECTSHAKDILSYPVVIANNEQKFRNLKVKAEKIYVFLDNITEIDTTLKKMDDYFIFDPCGEYYFIICSEISNVSWIYDVSELIWQHSILNFVLIYETPHLNVIGYNPFNKTILNFTHIDFPNDIFPNKFDNLYGYEIKVAIYNDFPRNIYKDGQFRGLDGNLLNLILTFLNATAKYYYFETAFESIICLGRKDADLLFISVSALSNHDGLQFSQSMGMEDLVVIVPRQKEHISISQLFHLFHDKLTWIIYILFWTGVIIITHSIRKIEKSSRTTVVKTFMDILAIGMALPIPDYNSNGTATKILFLFLFFCTLIFQSLFNGTLLGLFINLHTYNNIKTLQELEDTHMPIFIDTVYLNSAATFNPVITNFQNATQINMLKEVITLKEDRAYALTESYYVHTFAGSYEKSLKMERQLKKTYNILKEHVIPSVRVYLFNFKTPYIDVVNKIIRIDQECMLSNHVNSHIYNSKSHVKSSPVLHLQHFAIVFHLLLTGSLLGIIIFITEILWFKLV